MNLLIEKEQIKQQVDLIDNEEFIFVIKNLFSYYVQQKNFANTTHKSNSPESEEDEKDDFFDICGIWENRNFIRSKAWRTEKWQYATQIL